MHKIVLFTTFFFTALSSSAKQSSTCAFIENKGQIIDQNNQPNPSVKYLYNGGSMKLQLRESSFSYEVLRSERLPRKRLLPASLLKDRRYKGLNDSIVWYSHRVDVSLINANPHPKLLAEEAQTEVLHFYTVGTPEEGITNVHQYRKVTYKDIYPNIDLEFISSDDATHPFKYNFIVHPGGDVNSIRLHYEGADATALDQGSILIRTAQGNLNESIPASFIAENSKSVHVDYTVLGTNTYGFKVGKYPITQTLVIDPWATYFGWDSSKVGGLVIGDDGKILTSGYTEKSINIASMGSYQTTIGGNWDAVYRKWNFDGFPIWTTYYGGSEIDAGGGVGFDSNGNIFISGSTFSSNNIATPGSFIDTYQPLGGTNIFLAKFTSNGLRTWATYIPMDFAGLCIDQNGNIILGGSPSSSSGLATPGAHQTNYGGGVSDAFLMKFNTNGLRLWSTYYGGTENETSISVAVDPFNNIYLTGCTRSINNIATPGSFQPSLAAFDDVFIVKFNSSGVRQWGTYYGGTESEEGGWTSIAPDHLGNFYISGPANSPNVFATPGAFQSSINIVQDIFLSKFTGTGQRLWSTYFGGSNEEVNSGVLSDNQGNALLAGLTLSKNVIATPGAFIDTFSSDDPGVYDAFLEKFSPTGQRIWGTYIGGSADDNISGLAVTSNDNIVLEANISRAGIATAGAYCTTLSPGGIDGYLASIDSSGKLTTPVPELSGSSASIIQVYPNPAKDLVQISLPSLAQGTITISDAMGKVVKSVAVKSQEMTIDIKDLPAGVFLLQYDDGAVCETVKVVKE